MPPPIPEPVPPPEPPPEPPTPPAEPPKPTNREKLYAIAKACIGRDMSPLDIAPDSLACAESFNGVWEAAFGQPFARGAALTSTAALYAVMRKDPRLEEVDSPLPGDPTIAPTGYSSKHVPHGHCGIWGVFNVMSNDSDSGKWKANYTHAAWINVFHKELGFPIHYFRVKG